jgi:hypothetical protein
MPESRKSSGSMMPARLIGMLTSASPRLLMTTSSRPDSAIAI